MAHILIIDDDVMLCEMVAQKLSPQHDVSSAYDLADGLQCASDSFYELILLDVRLPDGSGLEAISQFQTLHYQPEIIIITGEGAPEGAELALMTGAWDYIEKPLSMRTLTLQVTRALEYRREKSSHHSPVLLKREGIIGKDSGLLVCLEKVAASAATDISVLITGETGTGKELFARAVHDNSERCSGPFVVLDCAAFPEQLMESVLFGHTKGAFTGAHQAHDGLISQANRGTLFMDEVGELPMAMQKPFLRVLQEKTFRPVGGKTEETSDFRLVAATNRDLEKMVGEGTFRQDLFFRLNVSSIGLPPLRTRASDVEELVLHYTGIFCKRYGVNMKGISDEFLEVLDSYSWPGNIRELVNIVNVAVANAQNHETLLPIHLPVSFRVAIKYPTSGHDMQRTQKGSFATPTNATLQSLKQSLEETEKQYFQNLMSQTDGDIGEACRISGLSRSGLYSRLKKYNISRPD